MPPAFIQAVNIATSEYSWAQSLVVAMHSMKLAFGDNVTYTEIPLEQAADELDALRRQHSIASTTPWSKYFLANCRALHSREVTGPTAVAGWKSYVSGEPMIRCKNIIVVGDSGTRFYPANGKKPKSLVEEMCEHSGYPNMHDLTEIGAHPWRWVQMLQEWKARHYRLALPTMKPDESVSSEQLQFGSDVVVLVFDAHNGLQLVTTRYTGLDYTTAIGTTMFEEYKMLMKELTSFSQVVYGFSACSERFAMDVRLEREGHACAALATSYGFIAYPLAEFWEIIKPFCLNMEEEGKLVNLWHHTDYGSL